MTNHNINDDRSTRELIAELARRQAETQTQLDMFLETANQVLARSAVLDDVVLELRDTTEQHQRNFEEHQRNFEEHQRTSNAALERLEAILLQLIKNSPQSNL